MLYESKIWFGKAGDEKIYALPKMANTPVGHAAECHCPYIGLRQAAVQGFAAVILSL